MAALDESVRQAFLPARRIAAKIAPKLVAAMAVNGRLSGNVTEQETVAYKRVSERLRYKDRAAAEAEWTAAIRGTQRRGVRPGGGALAGSVVHHACIAGSNELWRLDAEDVEEAQRRESLPEVRRGGKVADAEQWRRHGVRPDEP